MEERLRSAPVKPAVDLEASRDKRVQVSVRLRADGVADKLVRRRTLGPDEVRSGDNHTPSTPAQTSWLRLGAGDAAQLEKYRQTVDEAQAYYAQLRKLCPTEERGFDVPAEDQVALCELLLQLCAWLKTSRTAHSLFMDYGGGARILSCMCIQNLNDGMILRHVLSLLDFLTSVESAYATVFIKANALKVLFTFVSQAIEQTFATHMMLHIMANIVSDSAAGRDQLLALQASNGATLLDIATLYLTREELQTTEIVRGCAHLFNAITCTRPPLPGGTVAWLADVIIGPASPGLIFSGDAEVVCDAVIALNNLVSCGSDDGTTAHLVIERIQPEILHRAVTILMQPSPADMDDDMHPATQTACLGVLSAIISRTPAFTIPLIQDCGLLAALCNLLTVYDPSLNEKALFIISNICVESTDRLQGLLGAGVFDWVDRVACRTQFNVRQETCILYCQALKVATIDHVSALLAHCGTIFDAIVSVLPFTNNDNKFMIMWMIERFLAFGESSDPNPVVALCMPLVPTLLDISASKEATARVNALADDILTQYLGQGDDSDYAADAGAVRFTLPASVPDESDMAYEMDKFMTSLSTFGRETQPRGETD